MVNVAAFLYGRYHLSGLFSENSVDIVINLK